MKKIKSDNNKKSCKTIPRGSVYILPVTEERFQISITEIYKQVESSRIKDENNYKQLIKPKF